MTKTLVPEKLEKQDDKTKIVSIWEKGKCFKCQEPWVPGHNKVCKFRNQIHMISILDEDSSEEDITESPSQEEKVAPDDNPELMISIHALSGTASHASTFPLFLHLGNQKLVALVDSGSTTSFTDLSVVEKSIIVSNHDPLKVTVANGNVIWIHVVTSNCSYNIQGHEFESTFRVLELQGYDIILGCDWLYEYSLVGLNLKSREFTLEKEGTKLTFLDETLPNKHILVTQKNEEAAKKRCSESCPLCSGHKHDRAG
jgi:hypothetical protein